MYVGDRDTRDDVFCQDCGNIKDWESLETWAIEMEWEPEIDEGIGDIGYP